MNTLERRRRRMSAQIVRSAIWRNLTGRGSTDPRLLRKVLRNMNASALAECAREAVPYAAPYSLRLYVACGTRTLREISHAATGSQKAPRRSATCP